MDLFGHSSLGTSSIFSLAVQSCSKRQIQLSSCRPVLEAGSQHTQTGSYGAGFSAGRHQARTSSGPSVLNEQLGWPTGLRRGLESYKLPQDPREQVLRELLSMMVLSQDELSNAV